MIALIMLDHFRGMDDPEENQDEIDIRVQNALKETFVLLKQGAFTLKESFENQVIPHFEDHLEIYAIIPLLYALSVN